MPSVRPLRNFQNMNVRILLVVGSFILSVATGLILGRGGAGAAAGISDDKLVVGLSLDTLKEERWQGDRDLFVSRVRELGAEVIVQSANSDDTVQISDVETLITTRSTCSSSSRTTARRWPRRWRWRTRRASRCIAYDRLITRLRPRPVRHLRQRDGRRAAGAVPRRRICPRPGKGSIVRIYGSKTDNNAALFKQGQDNVLEPLHRPRRHRGRARGLGRGLEAGERQEDRERRDHRRTGTTFDAILASQRRHRRRRDPGAHRGRARRQGARHRPGRRARRLPAHRRRHAGDDDLQAAEDASPAAPPSSR